MHQSGLPLGESEEALLQWANEGFPNAADYKRDAGVWNLNNHSYFFSSVFIKLHFIKLYSITCSLNEWVSFSAHKLLPTYER